VEWEGGARTHACRPPSPSIPDHGLHGKITEGYSIVCSKKNLVLSLAG